MCRYCMGRDTARIIQLLEVIVAKEDEILAQVKAQAVQITALEETLQTTLDTEQTEVTDALATLQQTILELRAEIAAGANEAVLQEIADTLTENAQALEGIKVRIVSDLQNTVTQPEPPILEG